MDERRPSEDSRVSVENALLNVAASHISSSMNMLNKQEEVCFRVNRQQYNNSTIRAM